MEKYVEVLVASVLQAKLLEDLLTILVHQARKHKLPSILLKVAGNKQLSHDTDLKEYHHMLPVLSFSLRFSLNFPVSHKTQLIIT